MFFDLLHDTSVNDEVIDCAQFAFYRFQLSFISYFIHCSVLSHVLHHQTRQDVI